MLHRIFFVFSLLFFTTVLTGQSSDFSFSGLERTRSTYLANFLRRIKETNPAASADYLRQQLVNLPIITDATYQTSIVAGDTSLSFQIEESRSLFPIVDLGGIRDNFYFRLGFTDNNWRGRGQQLTLWYQNSDRQHNVSFFLRNASINNGRWGHYLGVRRFAAIEPLYFPEGAIDYHYENIGVALGGSYQLTNRKLLELGVDVFRENYNKLIRDNQPNSVGPATAQQNKLLGKLRYRIDLLDYGSQLKGIVNEANAQIVNNLADQSWFFILWNDLRFFRPTDQQGVLAGRLRVGISTNNESPFAPFVLDSQINIRGSGNRIDRGTAQLIFNLEYRHRVWQDRKERYSAQLVGFSDLGSWRNPGGEIGDVFDRQNFRHFVGAGFRLVYNKGFNSVIRLDYGVDVYNSSERGFVAGFGQYF